MDYVPLWCKSNYSFLEGAPHPEELVERAHALGLPGLALTDRDGVYGIVRAHVRARELGVHLILAEVRVRGRVLAVTEQDGAWMYGVSPGDLAASGATIAEAHAAFRRAFTAVLFDIAEDASSFEDFAAR